MLESSPPIKNTAPVSPASQEGENESVMKCVKEAMVKLKAMTSPAVKVVWGEGLKGSVSRVELLRVLDIGLGKQNWEERKKVATQVNNSGPGAVFYPFVGTFEVDELKVGEERGVSG